MKKEYTHLDLWERQCLFVWYHYEKKSMRAIARQLGRSHSTISRELKRNISTHYVPTYYPHPAQRMYQQRIRNKAQRPLLKSLATRHYVIDKLKMGWSPEIISGRLKHENKLDSVCHESIYQFIYKESPELRETLPRKHKKRRTKYPKRKYISKIGAKTSILERPEGINERSIPGHWESDSLESKGRTCALNVLLERTSRITHITRLKSKRSNDTKNAIIDRLSEHPNRLVNSITYDNGIENALHLEINQQLECDSFFCQPYHSWEKGSVEQINSLIRRFLPKGTDFSQITNKTLREIEYQINSRPRKCLGFKTPIEVYNEICGALST